MTIAEIAVLSVLIASVVLSVWLGFFAPRVLIISSTRLDRPRRREAAVRLWVLHYG
jgi:hypothetical protein